MNYLSLGFILIFVGTLFSCENENIKNDEVTLEEAQKSNLLYLLEEEKLARDIYILFDEIWGLNQFRNIKNSEEAHIGYVSTVLDMYKIEYELLPIGEFKNIEIQGLYDSLALEGKKSSLHALMVGAFIEDLDISDLNVLLESATKDTLIDLYTRLLCGSKNHMRAFNKGIEKEGSYYEPEFISEELFDEILSSQNEHCH